MAQSSEPVNGGESSFTHQIMEDHYDAEITRMEQEKAKLEKELAK